MRQTALLGALATTALMIAPVPALAAGERAPAARAAAPAPARTSVRTYVNSGAVATSPANAANAGGRNWGSVPQVQLKPPRGNGSGAAAHASANASSAASASGTAHGQGWSSGGGWGGNPPRPGYGGHSGGGGSHHGGDAGNGGSYGARGYYRGGGYRYPGGYDRGYYADGGYRGGVNDQWDGQYSRPQPGYRLPTYFVSPRFYVMNWGAYALGTPPTGYRWVRYYDDAVLIDRRGNIYDTAYDIDWDQPGGRYDDRAEGYGYDDGPAYGAPGYASGASYRTTYAGAPGTTTVVVTPSPVTITTTTTSYVEESTVRRAPRRTTRPRPRAAQCNCR